MDWNCVSSARTTSSTASVLRSSVGASYVIGNATGYVGYMGRRETSPDARFGIAFVGLGYQVTPALHLSGAYYRYSQSGNVTSIYAARIAPGKVLTGTR